MQEAILVQELAWWILHLGYSRLSASDKHAFVMALGEISPGLAQALWLYGSDYCKNTFSEVEHSLSWTPDSYTIPVSNGVNDA